MNPVFADTFFFLALLNPRDAYHAAADALRQQLSRPMVTTQWVLTEVGDALAAPNERWKFPALLATLAQDRAVTVVPATDELFRKGAQFYGQRADKDWPLTDCISSVVMAERSITEALTADSHFKQAGFAPLLARA